VCRRAILLAERGENTVLKITAILSMPGSEIFVNGSVPIGIHGNLCGLIT
jgi:hypothetical protein